MKRILATASRAIGSHRFTIVACAVALCLGIAAISVVSSQTQDQSPLRQVADIQLPGKPVRFDYQSLHASHGRLYIAHMHADRLVVFDTKQRQVVANLDGFPSSSPPVLLLSVICNLVKPTLIL